LEDGAEKPQLVQIKVGIGDGISTEVVEGLKENQKVVIGLAQPASASAPAGGSPFGGPRHF
jgi:HlyD family secretion protein